MSEREVEPQGGKREMLDRWAANHADRRVIMDFLEFCSEKRVELCVWEGANWPCPVPGGSGRLLDEYHEIDQQQLDRERVALLNEHRAKVSA